ncbi:GntR family transcriptional regulator [uncultured Hydrogenophaga sp.]|uniref:GntR family transcriptional regulator n=1 Tax=uncultured Hydrogenophaga sp. TaxID=199683 RepID=UPI0025831A42|nr:GntR family transcriptional regulator [uncultured Hydrogenophaga sp.]
MATTSRTSTKPAKPTVRKRSTTKTGRPDPLDGIERDSEDQELARLSSGERAYRILLRAIERGDLAGGSRLREAELATRIGLSRTPVREALARLEEQGLVINEGTRGLVVTELDHRAVSELFTMREVLEGTAARLAAQHATDVEVAILRKLVERHAQLTDPHDLAENHRLFHGTLYRCSHNRYLLKMLRGIHEAMLLLGQSALPTPDSAEAWTREHVQLLEALERRDSETAEKLARSQIAAAFKLRLGKMLSDLSPTALNSI